VARRARGQGLADIDRFGEREAHEAQILNPKSEIRNKSKSQKLKFENRMADLRHFRFRSFKFVSDFPCGP